MQDRPASWSPLCPQVMHSASASQGSYWRFFRFNKCIGFYTNRGDGLFFSVQRYNTKRLNHPVSIIFQVELFVRSATNSEDESRPETEVGPLSDNFLPSSKECIFQTLKGMLVIQTLSMSHNTKYLTQTIFFWQTVQIFPNTQMFSLI